MIIKDITAGKKYTTKTGEERTRWTNVGSLFIRDDGKMVVKMNEYINPLAFANEKGEVWFNVFDKEEKAENGPRTSGNTKTYGKPTEEEKQRIMADGRAYSSKWREQAQGNTEYIPDGTEVDGEMY